MTEIEVRYVIYAALSFAVVFPLALYTYQMWLDDKEEKEKALRKAAKKERKRQKALASHANPQT